MWASTRENLYSGFVNNKAADQPAHLRTLVSVFVIYILESIRSNITACEISIFLVLSVANKTGLSLALLETLKTRFVSSKPIIIII